MESADNKSYPHTKHITRMEPGVFVGIVLVLSVLFFAFWYFRPKTTADTTISTADTIGTHITATYRRSRLRGVNNEILNLGSRRRASSEIGSIRRAQEREATRQLQLWDFGSGAGHVYKTRPVPFGSAAVHGPYLALCHGYCEDDERCVAARYRDTPGSPTGSVCDLYDNLTTFRRSILKPPCVGRSCVGEPDDYRDGVWVLKTRRRRRV